MALTPGEKVTLVKRCAQALASQEWSEILLAIKAFGLPSSPLAPGMDRYDYAVDHIQGGDDESIVALHAHLYPDATTEPATEQVGPWAEGHFRLFLSHAHEHRGLAGDLRGRLLTWSIDTFVAHDMIEPTHEWQGEIESALGTCDALAALLTPEFVQSKWCDQEVGFCLARGVLVIPIRLDTLPHGFLGKFQALDGAGRSSFQLAFDIFRTLASSEMVGDKMLRPMIQRYVHSPSFDGTREAYELLQTIPAEKWTEEMVRAVEVDALENNQVTEAVALPDARPMPEAVSALLDDRLSRGRQADDGRS